MFLRVLFLLAAFGASGCSFGEPARHYLQRQAGLKVCPSIKITELSEAKYMPDVSHFAFHTGGSCRTNFIRSAFASSLRDCAAMLPTHHSCSYIYNGGPSVIVEETGNSGDFRVTIF